MRERRKNFRVEWNSPAKIYDSHGRFTGRCIVSNFSNDGAKIIGLEPSIVPDEFVLRMTPRGRAKRCRLRLAFKGRFGSGIYCRRYQRTSSGSAATRSGRRG